MFKKKKRGGTLAQLTDPLSPKHRHPRWAPVRVPFGPLSIQLTASGLGSSQARPRVLGPSAQVADPEVDS